MSFPQIAAIILETSKSLSISPIENHKNKEICLILGGNFSGKSTTMSFLNGDKMVFERGRYGENNKFIGH